MTSGSLTAEVDAKGGFIATAPQGCALPAGVDGYEG
jgi:hypothetical protein